MADVRTRLRDRQAAQTAWAFFHVGYLDAISYPLTFVTNQLIPLSNVFLFYFVAKIVTPDQLDVAADFFTFAVLGSFVLRVLGGGLEALGLFMQRTIDQGQLELYLTQPMRWWLLPFAWFEWLVVERFFGSVLVFSVAFALGARIRLGGLLAALVVLALGTAATHAIGIAAASFRLLAKRADPIMTVYTIATTVLSGVLFPVKLLPGWLQVCSWTLPHTYTVDAIRLLLMPHADSRTTQFTVWQSIGALTAFCIVLYPVSILLFRRSIEYAREHGLIGAY
jgi:ABC-type multidrug transport system permease subunit